jgi:hypothetical protein
MINSEYVLNLATGDSTGTKPGDQLMKDLKSMGQIILKFEYVTNLRDTTKPLEACEKAEMEQVPEKALKGRALSHQST